MDLLRDSGVRGAGGDPQQGPRPRRGLLGAGRAHLRAADGRAAVLGRRPDAHLQPHPEGYGGRGDAQNAEQARSSPHPQAVQARAGREAGLPARRPAGRAPAQVVPEF